jgi:hypothetical protein
MIFKTLYGSTRKLKKASAYRVDWLKGSRSKFQKRIKNILYSYWENHIVFEEFPIVGTRLTLDFYNATLNIAIEVQGRQHTEYVEFFHGKSKLNYLKQLKRDQDKLNFCEINDISLVEIHDEDDVEYLRKMLTNGL